MKKWIYMAWFVWLGAMANAQSIPSVKITELEKYITTSDSVLVINFWATFCKPCVEEIPYLQSISKKYAGQKVKLLLVSLDVPAAYPARLGTFIKKNQWEASVWWLNETDADYFCPKVDTKWSGSIPATLIVNPSRQYKHFSEQQLSAAEFEQQLKKAIGN